VEELARLGADLSMRNQHCLTALDIAVRKTRLLRHFYILKKPYHFTKTGSGQTYTENSQKKWLCFFSLGALRWQDKPQGAHGSPQEDFDARPGAADSDSLS
jgi:hypothetical protein